MQQDVQYLAGKLEHRHGATELEHQAADYLEERFRTHSPFTFKDTVPTIESSLVMYAMYYGEFLVVAALAMWIPWFAFGYGLFVFAAYLAEVCGYRVLSRFLPKFESHNITAHFHAARPERRLVIVANYDTGVAGELSGIFRNGKLHRAHALIVICMMAIIVSCAAQGMGTFADASVDVAALIQWSAVAVLLAGAYTLYVSAKGSDYVRGANNNASGVAVLLELAGKLVDEPLDTTDVWLVAVGAHESGPGGMQQVMRQQDFGRSKTYFISIAGVGAGQLSYTSSEGILQKSRSSRELVTLAGDVAKEIPARPEVYRGLPTCAYVPLMRGYKTLSVLGMDSEHQLAYAQSDVDDVNKVEPDKLGHAAAFVEAVARKLDRSA